MTVRLFLMYNSTILRTRSTSLSVVKGRGRDPENARYVDDREVPLLWSPNFDLQYVVAECTEAGVGVVGARANAMTLFASSIILLRSALVSFVMVRLKARSRFSVAASAPGRGMMETATSSLSS
jgi:hypothetical protein